MGSSLKISELGGSSRLDLRSSPRRDAFGEGARAPFQNSGWQSNLLSTLDRDSTTCRGLEEYENFLSKKKPVLGSRLVGGKRGKKKSRGT